jgi:hypothetical protein
MLGRLIAILTFRPRTDCLTSRAKLIDGDTSSAEGGQAPGIDAPELDQTFWWRGQHIACNTRSMAAF